MRAHAQADDRHFAHGIVAVDIGGIQAVFELFHQFERGLVIGARHGE